ncbi:MAG: Gfo/Idh/MocA family oxidoreductase [Bryobacteraceae bacterium]
MKAIVATGASQPRIERRHFLAASAGALVSSQASVARPNDTVRVLCVGLHGRGREHLDAYMSLPNVQIAALCDVDDTVLRETASYVEEKLKRRPATHADLRRALEDQSIDAVSIATPNHWHTLQTIWSCQAGKDVYVEKPCTHNVFEARQIVAAARRYDRIVQHGSQSRSSEALQEAVARMRSGLIGEVYMARALCFRRRDSIGRAAVEPVPRGVDYDLWLGPAPKRGFTRNRFHYNWHWFWDYGNGDLGNQCAHEVDIARWGLGVRYPTRVSAFGGHYMFDDDQETPNTLSASFEFDCSGKKKMMVAEIRHWISNHEAGISENRNGPGKFYPNTIGNLFYGSRGYLAIDGYSSYKSWLGPTQEPGPTRAGYGDHFANFIAAVRTRNRASLTAEIEEGAISTTLVHLANLSYRLGRTLRFDETSYCCPGDEEATEMFRGAYRAPFVVPALM